jgi:hypothetical protein
MRQGWFWSVALAATVVIGGAQGALAAPPAAGEMHDFTDPVFRGTIFCDTLDAVEAIAKADAPDDMYAAYYLTANQIGEPFCMAIAPKALVVAVTPIGVMSKNGHDYDAWAVETRVGDTTVYALYLERSDRIAA